jgi:hypothetical protein
MSVAGDFVVFPVCRSGHLCRSECKSGLGGPVLIDVRGEVNTPLPRTIGMIGRVDFSVLETRQTPPHIGKNRKNCSTPIAFLASARLNRFGKQQDVFQEFIPRSTQPFFAERIRSSPAQAEEPRRLALPARPIWLRR